MNQQQLYDKYKRNQESKKFYNSDAWITCRENVLIRDDYLCHECLKDPENPLTPADMVHHIKPLEEYPGLALDEDNLTSLCNSCHNKEHPEKGGGKRRKKRNLNVVEFDANPEIT
ncbi:HNH endonuclease [Bacillus sp. FJAT-49732]|uniref:Putative HNH nuclease YajD n=1 Tax=Lederbergia citrisecunda TaxID=2833583 RepID=A0A942YKI4_9BACI|nr:HNH endonuclease signature motif containing protein [Lederbergia citrisecunda]MBS4198605.1 HNH endonuclease [Lederbergia citrisecunda]